MAVRRERVILDLQDDFTPGIARAAAATALLNRNLNDLDGRATGIRRPIGDAARETDRLSIAARGANRDVDALSRTSQRSGNSINQLTGRLQAAAKAAIVFGPALAPIGAVAVPAITGLASQLGFAAIGMGTLVVAAQGVGDALKAVNEAALEPTAANLEKAHAAMAKLGPEAQDFVQRFQQLRPVLGDIRDAAARGWFPGLTESLGSLDKVAPRIESLFETIGKVGGSLVAEGANALAGPEWADFLAFVEREGPSALEDLGRTVGNVTRGLAELWMAFDPLNDDFSTFLLNASRGFAEWADGLAETQGFADFIEYVRASAPQVRDTLSEIAGAVVAVVKAASPLGGPVLEAFEAVAEAVKAIAESPLGPKIFTMAAAFLVLNKTLAVTAGLLARMGFVGAAGAARGMPPGGSGGAGGGIVPITQRAKAASGAFRQLRTDVRSMGTAYAGMNRAQSTALSMFSNTTGAAMRTRSALAATGTSALKAGAGVGAFAVATGAMGEGLGLQNAAMLGLVGTMINPLGGAIGATVGYYADLKKAVEEVNEVIASGDRQLQQDALEKRLDTYSSLGGILSGKASLQGNEDIFSLLTTGESSTSKLAKETGRAGSLGNADIGSMQEAIRLRREQADTSRLAAAAELGLSSAASNTAAAVGMSNENLAESISLLERRTLSAFGAFGAETRWRDAMRAATAQANASNAGIRGNSEAAIKNRSALENLAGAWRTQRDAMVANGAAADTIEGKYRRSRRAFVQTAVAMGVPIARARELARELIAIPESVKVNIATRGDTATLAKMRAIRQEAQSVAGEYRLNFIVTQTNRINKPPAPQLGQNYTGGYTGPGGKYEPAGVVHRDEVVIPKELVKRDRNMLLSRYGHLPGMDQLHTGGLAGYASGGRVGSLPFADLPAYNLTTLHLGALNKVLAASTKALEREKNQRDAVVDKMKSLKGDVAGKFRSDLFGESNPWNSSDTGYARAMSLLQNDTANAKGFKADVAALKRKGLNGAALADLLTNGDATLVDSFANQSKAALARYERAYNARASVTASAGASAASAAFGAELKAATRQRDLLIRRVEQVEAALRAEHKEDRRSSKRGAGSGARNRKRG